MASPLSVYVKREVKVKVTHRIAAGPWNGTGTFQCLGTDPGPDRLSEVEDVVSVLSVFRHVEVGLVRRGRRMEGEEDGEEER